MAPARAASPFAPAHCAAAYRHHLSILQSEFALTPVLDRVLTEGVVPSLHVQYKRSTVKQYRTEGHTLRTEITINDLRRLPLHGFIKRVPRSHRYRITLLGAQTAMFYVQLYARALREAAWLPSSRSRSGRGHDAFERPDAALTNFLREGQLVA